MADPHESFFAQPELWVLVGFVGFFAAVGKPLWKAIAGTLDRRAARIGKEIEEARRLREEAQDMLAEYQRKHRDALKEAEQIVAHAKTEAERIGREGQAKLAADLRRREEFALQRIAQAEQQATAEVRAAAVDVALAATRKLLEQRLDDDAHARLVDAAIRELPGKLN